MELGGRVRAGVGQGLVGEDVAELDLEFPVLFCIGEVHTLDVFVDLHRQAGAGYRNQAYRFPCDRRSHHLFDRGSSIVIAHVGRRRIY